MADEPIAKWEKEILPPEDHIPRIEFPLQHLDFPSPFEAQFAYLPYPSPELRKEYDGQVDDGIGVWLNTFVPEGTVESLEPTATVSFSVPPESPNDEADPN